MTEVVDAFRDELRRIFRLRPVFSVLIGAVLIYAAFYPQPYLAEALRDVPIVVVDRDGTAASREMARRIDATGWVEAPVRLTDSYMAAIGRLERAAVAAKSSRKPVETPESEQTAPEPGERPQLPVRPTWSGRSTCRRHRRVRS